MARTHSETVLIADILVLAASALLLALAALRGRGRQRGSRVLNGVFAALFLGYAIYLALFFKDGTVWAFALAAVAVFRAFRAWRTTRAATGELDLPRAPAEPVATGRHRR